MYRFVKKNACIFAYMSLSFKIMNIEQGISNDEVEINFEIHYSLFDIRYFLKPEAKTAAT